MEGIDVKHMRIFLLLVREKSASRVAFESGMSQQAISGYLKRLRDALPHEIFLRHSSGLEPTDFALDVARKFERILAEMDGVFQAEVFDPAALDRCVGIIANEYAQLSMLPKFVARIREVAPRVRLKVMDFDRSNHAEQLARGDAEIAIGFSTFLDASLMRASLVDEHYCCVVGERSTIPAQLRRVGDVGKFARVDFAEGVSHSGDAVSRFLAAHDVLHPPVGTLACYTSLRPFLDFNDALAFVPSAIATACQLPEIDFGGKPEGFTAAVAWHRRSTGNPLGIWLREVLLACLGEGRER
ncbi:LysR family transcriptional regulator [Pandoraea sp. NPDC087047]|uniref:LysR family transcriptional regulator n=1 Tax=Pandoraea sp. NPDC087047 TaxID=3364390 RepID=UPI00380526EF